MVTRLHLLSHKAEDDRLLDAIQNIQINLNHSEAAKYLRITNIREGAMGLNKKLTVLLHDGEAESLLDIIKSIQVGQNTYVVARTKGNEQSITFLRVIKKGDGTERLTDELTDEEYKQVTDIYMASIQS